MQHTIIYKSNITFLATYGTAVNQTGIMNLATILLKMARVKESISIPLNLTGLGTD